jgi:hypothetical protein
VGVQPIAPKSVASRPVPARSEIIVNFSRSKKAPRNWPTGRRFEKDSLSFVSLLQVPDEL